MNIKKSDDNFKYQRKIEGMGSGLVFFKISANDKRVGANYHLFFKNGWKPPLDVAINTESSNIEYISFFAQDEKIINGKINNTISFIEDNIKIIDFDFSEKNYEKSIQKDFNFIRVDNDIILLSKNMEEEILGYKLNESNYILCNKSNDIVGVLMKQILPMELDVLQETKIISNN